MKTTNFKNYIQLTSILLLIGCAVPDVDFFMKDQANISCHGTDITVSRSDVRRCVVKAAAKAGRKKGFRYFIIADAASGSNNFQTTLPGTRHSTVTAYGNNIEYNSTYNPPSVINFSLPEYDSLVYFYKTEEEVKNTRYMVYDINEVLNN